MFYKQKASEQEIITLVKQLKATKEVTYIDDRSDLRYERNSPSIQNGEEIRVEKDKETRDRAQRMLRKIENPVTPHLLEALLKSDENDFDFYNRVEVVLAEKAKKDSDIYDQIKSAAHRIQDNWKMKTLINVMFKINPSATISYCSENLVKLNSFQATALTVLPPDCGAVA